jgi:sporulation protein YlmC with PRC-barrel domain
MLRNIEFLQGSTVTARDGDVGKVTQVYFDDEKWGVRYLVVETGDWLRDRQVLISPYAVSHTDPGSSAVHVKLTRQQVRDSPNIDAHKPVSRQHETEYLRYYGYPTYWGGANVWGMGAYPAFDSPSATMGLPLGALSVSPAVEPDTDEPPADIHLRSTEEVKGYHIETIDGTIGHVSGFVFDDEAWVIRYLTVDTRNWWPGGKEVLLATDWIELIDWFGSTVSTTLTREAIKHSPAYDDAIPVDRDYETALYDFYNKERYWSKDGMVSPGEIRP